MRFPRDWLGPLDELVPLGPSAGQDSDRPKVDEADPAPPAPAEGHVVDFAPSAPLRAEDFWGEDSAAIHDALEPPAQAAGPTATALGLLPAG